MLRTKHTHTRALQQQPQQLQQQQEVLALTLACDRSLPGAKVRPQSSHRSTSAPPPPDEISEPTPETSPAAAPHPPPETTTPPGSEFSAGARTFSGPVPCEAKGGRACCRSVDESWNEPSFSEDAPWLNCGRGRGWGVRWRSMSWAVGGGGRGVRVR